jgi:ketosteroid isomerase-like protein
MSHEPAPNAVQQYFNADSRRDIDAIVALFTADAIVVDEGQTRRGTTEIRDWQEGPASQYQYTTEVLSGESTNGDRYVVTGRLEGNFPGGTADLTWQFTLAGDLISRLQIAPPPA